MNRYSDIDRGSGVNAHEYGRDFIRVQFTTGATYRYAYASAGQRNIETMKQLADRGDGLNAFINDHAKKGYARREH